MRSVTAARWRRLQQVLDGALALAPDDVAPYLDRTCAADPALRDEVQRLLESCGRAAGGGFLDEPPSELAAALLGELPPLVGRRIGPYRVAGEAGRGGMGVVYLAERADGQFHQRVALKVVPRGLDTEHAVRRFLEERQILASLGHPGIARLLDGGVTDDGLPYFAMEYVAGTPIDRWCDERRLGVEARLRLLAEVCDAVQYAHQNLVVHRDLKPSNILVAEDGRVKLLDFGIAKLLSSAAAGEVTRTGARWLTPRYASPEQVRGAAVTTVSDVYSLGVLLYELLAGHPPYRLAALTPGELERVICEQDPTRPSAAVRRAVERGAVAADAPAGLPRGPRPERLSRRLRGDLDTIVLTAMQKDPARRYASAGALAEDLRRHLAGLPLRARPETLGYRASKFVRRHRVAVAAGVALAASLVAGAAGTASQAAIAARERDRARHEAATAARASAILIDMFRLSDPDVARGTTITAREVLARGARLVESELAGDPELQAVMLRQIGQVYQNLGLLDDAERMVRRAVAVWRARGPSAELAAGLQQLGDVELARARAGAAEAYYREALALRRALRPASPADVGASLLGVANALGRQRAHAAAEPLYREAVALARRAHGDRSPELAAALYAFAGSAHDRGDGTLAGPLFREALAIYRGLTETRDPLAATARLNLATELLFGERYAEAEPLVREALALRRAIYPDGHPSVVEAGMALATLLHNTSRFRESEAAVREAIAVGTRVEGPTHPDVLQARNILGRALHGQGRYGEAERAYREALAGWRTRPGPESPFAAYARLLLGESELAAGRLDAARADFAAAAGVAAGAVGRAAGPAPMLAVLAARGLAGVDLERGRPDSAEARLRWAAAALAGRVRPAQHDLLATRNALAAALVERRRYGEADSILRGVLALQRGALPPRHVDLARTLHGYGALRLAAGDPRGAEPPLREALAIRRARLDPSHPAVAETESALGAALAALGRGAEAEPLLAHAVETLRARRGDADRRTREARARLAAARGERGGG